MAQKRKLSADEVRAAVLDSDEEDMDQSDYGNSDDFESESDLESEDDVPMIVNNQVSLQDISSSDSENDVPGPSIATRGSGHGGRGDARGNQPAARGRGVGNQLFINYQRYFICSKNTTM